MVLMHVKISNPATFLPGYPDCEQPFPQKRDVMQKNNNQRSTHPYVQFEKKKMKIVNTDKSINQTSAMIKKG
jgi:hypothetical protein